MSGSNTAISSTKRKSTLVRPRFAPGMLLQHDDLEQLGTYTRELSRMLFRSFFGCGVVCGLKVTMEETCGKLCVSVEQGLALTCEGGPIYVPAKTTFSVDENCELDETELWVVLCGTSKCCAPRTASCPTDEDESSSVCTRERDWFEIKIVNQKPECVCGCETLTPEIEAQDDEGDRCKCVDSTHDCYKDHYLGKCGCDCEDCGGNCGDCILLARIDKVGEEWIPEHRVRRFIRPVLMRDPLGVLPKPAQDTSVASSSNALTAEADTDTQLNLARPQVRRTLVKPGKKGPK